MLELNFIIRLATFHKSCVLELRIIIRANCHVITLRLIFSLLTVACMASAKLYAPRALPRLLLFKMYMYEVGLYMYEAKSQVIEKAMAEQKLRQRSKKPSDEAAPTDRVIQAFARSNDSILTHHFLYLLSG